jgi:hypothetical protein
VTIEALNNAMDIIMRARNLLADYLGLDYDRDGMPYDWIISCKLDPVCTSDAFQDPDGDELKNLMEHQRKSNPYSFTSSEPFSLADPAALLIIFIILLSTLSIQRLGRGIR